MQVSIVLVVTIISYFIIIFNDDIIEIVKDFLAIEVIAALDDYFFSEHLDRSEVARRVISDEQLQEVLKIETTTSHEA